MLAIIAAIAKNNCIGIKGKLPWHIPEDLAHFKKLTEGKIVLMGKNTWESLPAKFRPLPNRTNVVIAGTTEYAVPPRVEVYATPEDALKAHPNEDIMVSGGGQIYAHFMKKADTLYITHVDRIVDGDIFFPPIDPTIWREVERENHDEFSFVTYKKI